MPTEPGNQPDIVTCQRGELKFDNLGGVITAIVDQYGAREESLKLADRVVSGKRLAISRGQKQGGLLFGYDREILDESGKVVRRVTCHEKFSKPTNWSSRLVPASDTQAVAAVRHMFQAVANGESCGAVARDLNRRGYRTMFGKRFNATSVRRTISNVAYAGDLASGKRRRRGRFRSLHDEGGVVCQNAHEPLVPRALFEKVQRRLRTVQTTSPSSRPGKYLLTGLIYLAETGHRLQGFTMSHSNRKVVRRYYGPSPRLFEEFPDDSDRPTFRADTIEQAVLEKLRAFLSEERNKRAIREEIGRRTKKAVVETDRIESQLAEIRSKIDRATENLALADRNDIPGITRLLATWRERESDLKEQLRRAHGQQAPTTEALAIISRLDDLLIHIGEGDREKLQQAIRQTVKRITLRRERRYLKHCRITLWDGVIELREEFGISGVLHLTDDEIPSPGNWREAARFVQQRNGVVFFKEVAAHMGLKGSCVSRALAQSVLSGKIRNLGHQKGWMAVEGD